MVKKTRVEIQGLRELGQALKELGDDVGSTIARSATAAAAILVKKAAIQNAPISDSPHQLGRRKDQIVQPGNLRRNIVTKRLPKKETKLTSEHIVTVRHGSGRAPKDAFYGRFVEFGTVENPPQPFLRPAMAERQGEAAKIIATVIKRRIDRANRKKAASR